MVLSTKYSLLFGLTLFATIGIIWLNNKALRAQYTPVSIFARQLRNNSSGILNNLFEKMDFDLEANSSDSTKTITPTPVNSISIKYGSKTKRKFRKHPKFFTKERIKMVLNHTEKAYYYQNLSCDVLHPQLLLYNRIFKTGSTSFNRYFYNNSENFDYKLRIGGTEDWYDKGRSSPYPEEVIKFSYRSETTEAGLSGHFYFRKKFHIRRNFTYINLVRDPVDRVISHYFYMRSTRRPNNRIREMKLSKQWNETLEQCFDKKHKGCQDNIMTRFFCGPDKFCKTGSKKSLNQAKFHIRRYYASVGILKYAGLFIKMLEKVLPNYFTSDIVFPQSYHTAYPQQINRELLEKIEKANWADRDLYNFISKRFLDQLNLCDIKLPIKII